jgi:hypothetical protein
MRVGMPFLYGRNAFFSDSLSLCESIIEQAKKWLDTVKESVWWGRLYPTTRKSKEIVNAIRDMGAGISISFNANQTPL